MDKILVDIVIPVFNEEECLPEMQRRLTDLRLEMNPEYDLRVIYVDDGSKDQSRFILREIASSNSWVKTVLLTRNFGHQIAVTAGLEQSTGDLIAIIDSDLQDPPELIPPMLESLRSSDCHVVFGQRESRIGETRFKTITASLFYRFIRKISSVDIPLDTGDFRVMDSMARDILIAMPERNRFLRGMIPWTGLRSQPFVYRRHSRYSGTTKYSMKHMLVLASNAVASFSITPLRAIQVTGILLTALATVAIMGSIIGLIVGSPPSTLLLLAIFQVLLTGVVLGAVGVLGGYLHRIQDEVRQRPLYLVDEIRN